MASVTSLGLHEPSGLPHAIREDIIPPNPSPSSYKWSVELTRPATPSIPRLAPSSSPVITTSVPSVAPEVFEDELLVTETTVIWTRGTLFRKMYSFTSEKETIRHALLARLPTSSSTAVVPKDQAKMETASPAAPAVTMISTALVVFLKTQAHVHFLDSASHCLHLPFEVQSVIALPIGLLVQHAQPELLATKMSPGVSAFTPENLYSSLSSGLSFSALPSGNDPLPTFVVNTPTKPAQLPRFSSSMGTISNNFAPPPSSHWPRLVTLLDPLAEMGLVVVTPPEPSSAGKSKSKAKTSSGRPIFLDDSEDIISICDLSTELPGCEPLILAVTINHDHHIYTVWRVRYIPKTDPFLAVMPPPSTVPTKVDRRRSSMAPGYGAALTNSPDPLKTPVCGLHHETLTGPGRRTTRRMAEREREREMERASEFVASLTIEVEQETTILTRRQSQRLSSLARGDVSMSQEKAIMAGDKRGYGHGHGYGPGHHAHAPAHGHGRLSNFGTSFTASMREDSFIDSVLEDHRAGGLSGEFGDSSFLHPLGINVGSEHEYDGLAQELSLSKIKTINIGALSTEIHLTPPKDGPVPKVFTLIQPASLATSSQAVGVQVAIQDSQKKQLDLITLTMHRHPKGSGIPDLLTLHSSDSRRAGGVVDSCPLVDGEYQMMLILSERNVGGLELSIQSAWSKPSTFVVPPLLRDHITSLQSSLCDTVQHKDGKLKNEPVILLEPLVVDDVVALRTRGRAGLVDMEMKSGLVHSLRLQLEPRDRIVRRALNMCRVVIPRGDGEAISVGWWMVMQWLQTETNTLDVSEWSGFSVLFLALYLAFNDQTMDVEEAGDLPGDLWKHIFDDAKPPGGAVPTWMLSEAWGWALDSIMPVPSSRDSADNHSFLNRHFQLACRFLTTHVGIIALGPSGFLPTSRAHPVERRISVARGLLLGFHLVLEEFKLDITVPEDHRAGPRVICAVVAGWLGWRELKAGYEMGIQEITNGKLDGYVDPPMRIPCPDPQILDIYSWITAKFSGSKHANFPSLIEILNMVSPEYTPSSALVSLASSLTPRTVQLRTFFSLVRPGSSSTTAAATVEAMYAAGFTSMASLETLPEAVRIPLMDPIMICQANPPSRWGRELLDLVGRADLGMAMAENRKRARTQIKRQLVGSFAHAATWDMQLLCRNTLESETADAVDKVPSDTTALVRALFRKDRRLQDAYELLMTMRPRTIILRPDPSWSESVYLEKQKDFVARMAIGSLAIPAGKALLTYGLWHPLPTQKININGFNLNCVIKPAGTTVGVDYAMFNEERTAWSWFHQGVSAGLLVAPEAPGIDSSWLLFNQPKSSKSNRHAGFLLGLGLNGHFKGMSKPLIYRYLESKFPMTSIGYLLGLAASYRGTMDSATTRIVSVHVMKLLPRGALDLNLSPMTQTAGLMGIGLLYAETKHRRMSETMLSEVLYMPEDPGPGIAPEVIEHANELRSEGYRLAAGFALGLINLGKGADLKELYDMDVTNRLLTAATGVKRADMVHVLDRSAPAAVMALALIHMKSNDQHVARKIAVPETIIQFDYVRPDLLLLRTVTKHLIMWDGIGKSVEWVVENMPEPYKNRVKNLESTIKLTSSDLAFWSILGGLCFALGLRWAGSGNHQVRDTLLHFAGHFMKLLPGDGLPGGVAIYDEELARVTVRSVLDNTLCAAGMVMAGTGDVPIYRRLRALHGRTDPDVPYGSHMACHMAIGLLFLGCGLQTLSTSDLSIASLLIAFYPNWPSTIGDCRGHLQAFRHLWVLGVEERTVVIRDIASDEILTGLIINLRLKDGIFTSIEAPSMLPPLDEIKEIQVLGGEKYWDAGIELGTNSEIEKAFRKNRTIYLHRRPRGAGPWGSREENVKDPFDWVYALDSLKNVSPMEKRAVSELAIGNMAEGASVDARLEVEAIPKGWGREGGQGGRVLAGWETRREGLKGNGEWWVGGDVLGGGAV